MIDQDKKIRKGLPPRRDEACYRVERDIIIPAGTLLRKIGDGAFSASIDYGGLSIIYRPDPGSVLPPIFRRVVA